MNRDPEDVNDKSIFEPVPLPFVVPTWVEDSITNKAYNFVKSQFNVQNKGTIIILPLDSKESFTLIHEMIQRLRSELILFLSKLDTIQFHLPSGVRTISRESTEQDGVYVVINGKTRCKHVFLGFVSISKLCGNCAKVKLILPI